MWRISTERKLHIAFVVSLVFKTLHALLEVLTGLILLLVNKIILGLLVWIATIGELGEDPNDFFARYAVNATNHLSLEGQRFIAYYLLSHGIIKLIALLLLWRQKLWAYPLSIAVFAGFVVYQVHRYLSTHSSWLLVFTLLDVIVIWLTVHEYRRRVRVAHA